MPSAWTAPDWLTFGECLLRLSAPNRCALSKRTAWSSRLPNMPLGQRALRFIAQGGVDVSDVPGVPSERMGLLFSARRPPP
ncbi:MAG: hypothetical protein J7551_01325 [Chloroflexi bacterium]|nr:hypothetical protein [Chloroflexota bacterium]